MHRMSTALPTSTSTGWWKLYMSVVVLSLKEFPALQEDEVGVLVDHPPHQVLAPYLQGCHNHVLQLGPCDRDILLE